MDLKSIDLVVRLKVCMLLVFNYEVIIIT
ncbi:hypothetical protein M2326_002335, partial [Flavobacterium sp. 7A]|nr:hypothetical protein [Flavobacterium sp. 7A]MCW2120020.1 hypothetical protein [Flavobacterium sp. 7A]